VIVVVLGAVLVTALTPLGTSMRELLFHTRATVAGSVTVDGKPAVSVHLKLDGVDSGNTDAGGRFVLTGVGKGQHRLHLELIGANPRDEVFSVASGQTILQLGNLEMDPLVRLGYTPSLHMSAEQVDYDITLWIIGDPHVLSRIKSVSYTLPAPLSPRPVSGAGANRAFCYRQTGSLPLQDFPLGSNAPVLALAIVDLGAGKQFQVSTPAGTTRPPDCLAHQAGSASPASTPVAPGQQPSSAQEQQPSSPGQSGSSPTPSAEVPNVIGDSQAAAEEYLENQGFTVSVETEPGPLGLAQGTVWSQNPGPGPEKPGSMVTILVQAQSPTSTPSR
jgi:PASTA domain